MMVLYNTCAVPFYLSGVRFNTREFYKSKQLPIKVFNATSVIWWATVYLWV